jgi:hypothetical protein
MAPLVHPRLPRRAAVALAVLMLTLVACDEPGPTGSPVCRHGATRITVFQGPDGECIPRNEVVAYRCDGADPIVVFDGGSDQERRFLGGDFAVPVPALPRDAEVVGVGDGAQLVRVRDEPRRVYTVRGTSVSRWLALPDPATFSGVTPSAFMVGDSLLDGGALEMAAALPDWSIEIDALNGRGSASGAAIAESRPATDQAVVVELGTNDQSVAAFTTNAERIMTSFRTAPLVLWQNVEAPPNVAPADEINAAIEALAGRRANVAVADWDEQVPEEFLSDGVHPDPEHLDAMATLIAPLLQRWLAAVTGQPSCR